MCMCIGVRVYQLVGFATVYLVYVYRLSTCVCQCHVIYRDTCAHVHTAQHQHQHQHLYLRNFRLGTLAKELQPRNFSLGALA